MARLPILLATGNLEKQKMLRWLLEGLPVKPTTPAELNVSASPDESADSHEAIARVKAEAWSSVSNITAIASDGGLLIPALGANWESRYTRRFAGPAADDRERQRQLLALLQPYSGSDREAAFVEGLAIAQNGNVLASWEVRGATGVIAERLEHPGPPAQSDGFWVFPIWRFPEFGRAYDQLTLAERASLGDHWEALRALVHQSAADWLA